MRINSDLTKKSIDQTNQEQWTDFKKWWVIKENEHLQKSKSSYENHPLLTPVLDVGNCVIAVIDIKSMQFLYNSPNYEEFMGFPKDEYEKGGVQFVFSKIVPDDQIGMIGFSKLINSYIKKLPDREKNHFRCFWDYRLKNSEGEGFRVLQHDYPLKYNSDGQIEEKLVFAFKISNVTPSVSQHLRMTNGKENLFYKYDHKLKATDQLQLLSAREIEIAKLIAQSNSLKKIADLLNISFNTVRVHHANAMHKMKVSDSIELVNVLRTWAFI